MSFQAVNRVIVGLALVGMLGISQATATTTNVVEWDFEEFSIGTAIVDTGGVGIVGWNGSPFNSDSNAAEVVAASPAAPPNGYPLPGSAHTKAMAVNGDVRVNFTNAWDVSQILTDPLACTNVIIDTLIKPGQLSFQPEFPTNAQFALYFDTNGNPVVAHRLHDSGCTAAFIIDKWTTLTHTNIASNAWVRVTVEVDYLSTSQHTLGAPPVGFADTIHFFRFWLDGVLVTHTDAYELINFPIHDCTYPPTNDVAMTIPNQWFLCADSGAFTSDRANNHYFSGIEFSGAGLVDDTTITSDNIVLTGLPPGCSYPPDYCAWIGLFPGISNDDPNVDADNDGSTNWEEFLAGTDPNDPNDNFELITVATIGNSSNCIMWLSSTNGGLSTPFTILRTTNLASPIDWTTIETNFARHPSGTNVYYDGAAPGSGSAFYQITFPTNSP